jgi:tRNA nucleotidyltransferase (CCA-adding enzyme)
MTAKGKKPSESKYTRVLEAVLKEIRPRKAEEKKLKDLALKVLKAAEKEAAKAGARPMLVGSLTRDTWLANKTEFDIFILFDPNLPREQLQEKGLKIGKAVVKKMGGSFQIAYAEHPYVSGKVKGIKVDIVPCYEIGCASELKSAVDRTPFHVRYIEKHLPLEKSCEVRLLKQFCKAHDIYGADAKVEGFSGYVCELLIVKYGSFLSAVKTAKDWNAGCIIDIEQLYDSKEHPKLRREFKDQPLILVDPIDKNRNAAAAVSADSLYAFRKAAMDFLAKPDKKRFFGTKYKPVNYVELKKLQKARGTEIILIRFNSPKVVDDIFWPQLRRFAERLESILRENEFSVIRKGVHVSKKGVATVLMEMDICNLPAIQKRIGPRVFDWDDSRRFVEKYKDMALTGPFVENNFWVVETKRKFLTAHDKLVDSLKDNASILKAKGIPSHIAEQIARKRGFEIVSDGKKVAKILKRDNGFGIFLRKYFEKESLA